MRPGLGASVLRDVVNGGVRMGAYPAVVRVLHSDATPAPLATRLSLRRTRSGDSQDAPGAERPRRSKMYRK